MSTTQDVPRDWPPFFNWHVRDDPLFEWSTDYLLPGDPLFWNVQYSLTPSLFQRHVLSDPHFYFKGMYDVSNDPLFSCIYLVHLYHLCASLMLMALLIESMVWYMYKLTQGVTLVMFWMQHPWVASAMCNILGQYTILSVPWPGNSVSMQISNWSHVMNWSLKYGGVVSWFNFF